MLKISAETSAEFLKNLNQFPSHPNEQLLKVQLLSRFPEWSNLRLEENPQICCSFDFSTQLNAHLGLGFNKQYKYIKHINDGFQRDFDWTVVQHTVKDVYINYIVTEGSWEGIFNLVLSNL